MKRININHLRAIKKFRNKDINYKISDYEKFLANYVSIPTARKIIKQLIELKIVEVIKSKEDLRVKYLVINDTDIEKYLWYVIVAELYNNVYNKDEGMRLYNNFTTLKQCRNEGCRACYYSHSIVAVLQALM